MNTQKEFTTEQLKECYDKLPKELQEAISSTDIHEEIKSIGQRRGLMIDQVGELVDHIGLVILGLAKSSDFVRDISRKLSIDEGKARDIADDINNEVLGKIRNAMQDRQQEKESDHSVAAVEQAGGFEIEKEPDGDAAGGTAAEKEAAGMTGVDKANMLSDIEEPAPAGPVNRLSPQPDEEIKSEPLVDQLLAAPVSKPEIRVEKKPEAAPQPKPPAATSKSDPYREAID